MARGGHGLPKVSPGPAMPDLSTPGKQATTEMASWLFLGRPARRKSGLRSSSTLLHTPQCTPMKISTMKTRKMTNLADIYGVHRGVHRGKRQQQAACPVAGPVSV
jgi:hypothetical protein